MINDDGKKLEALAQQESDLEQMQGMLSGALASSAPSLPGLRGAFQTAANTAIGAAFAGSKLDIEKERIRIDTVSKARVEYNQAQEQLIDSAARVKTLLLQIPTLKINALLAQDDIARLAGLLGSQLQQAQDAQAALGTDADSSPTWIRGAIRPTASTAITRRRSPSRRSTTRSTSCSW